MAFHVHGSSNPLGITGNIDRIPMHPYFIFKDAITVFVFLFVFALFVFFSPNTLGQKWPLITLLLLLQCAICWKYLTLNYNKTIHISGLFYANPLKVKYYYNKYNQQITKIILILKFNIINKIVEISETTRTQKILFKAYSTESPHDHFYEWLGGLIDGDGYFGITSQKYGNCEITVGIEDEKMLRQIQNKFGGSIKLRSGSHSIRYRLSNKIGLINLLSAVNGNIRHSKRLVQFYKVCNLYNIEVLPQKKLTYNNGWFMGFFDADGTINYYNYVNNRPQLFISVTNKYLKDVEEFQNILGGKIYFDKSQNGYFKWVITNETNHLNFYNYNKIIPSRSWKGQRIFLIPKFYQFYNSKNYIQNDSLLYKSWLKFDQKWKELNYKFK